MSGPMIIHLCYHKNAATMPTCIAGTMAIYLVKIAVQLPCLPRTGTMTMFLVYSSSAVARPTYHPHNGKVSGL